eukprot:10275368-Ditylum_brightwellii.AAC.1
MDLITQSCVASVVLLTCQASDNGITDETSKTWFKYWKHWQAYTGHFNCNAYLTNVTKLKQQVIFIMFAERVRIGKYSRGAQ